MSKIKHSRIVFPDRKTYRIEYSDEIVDLISKMLKKERTKRLGAENDAAEILEHPWFADIDMAALENLEIEPPFKPTEEGALNQAYFNISKGAAAESLVPKANLKLIKENQKEFDDFTQRK